MTVITNADGKLWLALKSRLDQWTECKVMLPMENYAPTATQTFIIAQNVSLEYGGPLPIHAQCGVPFVGNLSMGVCVPTDWSYSQLVGLAGRVADHFSDGLRMTYQDLTVEVSGRSKVSGTVSLQAPWNRLEVSVPWRAWG